MVSTLVKKLVLALCLCSAFAAGAKQPDTGKKPEHGGKPKHSSKPEPSGKPHGGGSTHHGGHQNGAHNGQDIKFPGTAPDHSVTVPADFVGFGFEIAFLNDYNNHFSENLINSVAARMSKPPTIRVGGTSGDRLTFDPKTKAKTHCVKAKGSCPNGSSATFILGPEFFDGFKAFPGIPMTFQVPIGRSLSLSQVGEIANHAYKALGANRLTAIALGNEVGEYEKTAGAYTKDVHAAAEKVIQTLNLKGDAKTMFEVMDRSSGHCDSGRPWTVPQVFDAGLNKNKIVKVAADHWYQIDSGTRGNPTLQQALLNHTAIVQKFKPYGAAIEYLRQHDKDVQYVLSETGGVLSSPRPIDHVFGIALWSVDFQLYSMSQGVARIHGTQRPAADHSLFVPGKAPGSPGAQVRAPFYAQPFVADFIGKTGGTTRVEAMDLKSDTLSAYGAYENNALARVALVNMHEWSRGDKGDRQKHTFAVKVPSGVTAVRIARLESKHGAMAGGFDYDKKNITYAGQQWTHAIDNGKGHPEAPAFETVQVSNGVAAVDVADSEAAIVHFK